MTVRGLKPVSGRCVRIGQGLVDRETYLLVLLAVFAVRIGERVWLVLDFPVDSREARLAGFTAAEPVTVFAEPFSVSAWRPRSP